jgi:hypothetical protein
MAQENVDLARSVYAAPSFFTSDSFAPDVEVDFRELYPDQPLLHGIDEVRRFRDETDGPVSFEPEEFIDIDAERVLVVMRTGSKHELTIRDGRIVRVKVSPL